MSPASAPETPGSASPFVERLRALDARGRGAVMLAWIRSEAARFLELEDAEEVHARGGFIDLGFDSVRAVDFKDLIASELGHELRTTLLFDYPTPEALGRFLLSELFGDSPHAAAAIGSGTTQGDIDGLSSEALRRLLMEERARLAELRARVLEPVAVVGIGCRFPGGITDLASFWAVLDGGVDAISEVPPDRWDIESYYDPERGVRGKMYARSGGFLGPIDGFDARFFNISPKEAVILDPQQRLLLEVAWEALESGAHAADRWFGRRVGVYVGNRGGEYWDSQSNRTAEEVSPYYGTGNSSSTAAGRISYFMGFTGPCVALDTACSASLVAVHLALQSLRARECDAALAGGVNLLIDPVATLGTCQANMLASDGRCKTFDASADGYGRAEGCGLLVLKRLSDATRDGDRIFALIRGTAINQDGASGGLTVPSGPAQSDVIRQALENAGATPDEVDYVEAHGTGTSLGDPIEIGALDAVFGPGRSRPLLVGSVKTNIGHAEPAAGVAGIIKVILSLQHERIPKNLHLVSPNPHIAWDETVASVVFEPTPWRRGQRRRLGGVSSFAFSGTNGHVVLEEAPAPSERGSDEVRPSEILVLSAKDSNGLGELTRSFARDLRTSSDRADDIAFTASTGRSPFPHRLAVVGAGPKDWIPRLEASIAGDDPGVLRSQVLGGAPRVAFLFTGQGAQYPGMGSGLYTSSPVFREALDRCATILDDQIDLPLLSLLFGEHSSSLNSTRYTQPALFALEYALGRMWMDWGILPSYFLGHSVGEYAAACLAGVFSLEDGLSLIAARGRLMEELTEPGPMMVVFSSAARVEPFLGRGLGTVSIAAINGPQSVVISGSASGLQAVLEALAAQGIATQPLSVSHAFHSPLMDPMLSAFARVAERVRYAPPTVEFISNLDPGPIGEALANPNYWTRHVRSPVKFHDGFRALLACRPDVLLEIGPRPVLLGMGRRIAGRDDSVKTWLPSLQQGTADWTRALESLASLWTSGAPVAWRGVFADRDVRPVALPTYPFQRQHFWIERQGRARKGSAEVGHLLIGSPLPVATLEPGQILFGSSLDPRSPPWLGDHLVFDHAVLPGAAFVEMGLALAARVLGGSGVRLERVSISKALVLPLEGISVQCVVSDVGNAEREFRILSLGSDPDVPGQDLWVQHATGSISPRVPPQEEPKETLDAIRDRCPRALDPADVYDAYVDLGLGYKNAFKGMVGLWEGTSESLAKIELRDTAVESEGLSLHPAFLDGCFQSCWGVLDAKERTATWLPIEVESVEFSGSSGTRGWAHFRRRETQRGQTIVLDLDVRGSLGELWARLSGLKLMRARVDSLFRGTDALGSLLYRVTWQQSEFPAVEEVPEGHWVVTDDASGLGAALVRRLGRERLSAHLAAAEKPLSSATWDDFEAEHGPITDVVHTVALEGDSSSPLGSRRRRLWETALLWARSLSRRANSTPRLWIITRGAQGAGEWGTVTDVDAGCLWGFGAALAAEEVGRDVVRVDLDPSAPDPMIALWSELRAPRTEDRVAWRQGRRLGARLTRGVANDGQGLTKPDGHFQLRAGSYGSIGGLTLLPASRRPPGPGEVQIAVQMAALNFKDVLYVLGLLKPWSEALGIVRAEDQPLGMEAAGTVLDVGSDVTDVAAGDLVFGGGVACMGDVVTLPATQIAPVPKGFTAEQAAGLPVVFMTALYALERVASLGPTDRILIHAAAGGVGQAALMVARRAGAEVFATASPGKWDELKRQGVRHVMNSRTLDYRDEILRLTHGRGVDVVLNSLSGDFIPANLEVLAPGGRFVEIGKVGVWSSSDVLERRPDVAYTIIEMSEILADDPVLYRGLLDDLITGIGEGHFRPLPTRVFSVTAAKRAFTWLAQARNIGKVVLSFADAKDAPVPVRSDRTYFISGGVGGLGRVAARALVGAGARHLLLASRSAPRESALEDLEALRALGASVEVVCVDVSNLDAVEEVLATVRAGPFPLGGVIHAAGLLDDGLVRSLEPETFDAVLRPKVLGAWNLHVATSEDRLEFFVCYSSVAAVVGSAGQAAYAAANAFLDGFASWRRAMGLAATTINWGPWDGEGMVSTLREGDRGRLSERGLSLISPEDGARILMKHLTSELPSITAFGVHWTKYLDQFSSRGVPAFFGAFAARRRVSKKERGAAIFDLGSAPEAKRVDVLRTYLLQELGRVMGFGGPAVMEAHQKFGDLGVDSLMAVDFKNRLETGLGHVLSATLVFDHPTLQELLDFLLALVRQKEVPAPKEQVAEDAGTPSSDLEDLPTDELARRLAEQIRSMSQR